MMIVFQAFIKCSKESHVVTSFLQIKGFEL